METKLDASLRQRMISLRNAQRPDTLVVFGRCTAIVDGEMRQSLVDAGAEVQTLANDMFTALIPSPVLLDVAALDFVTQLQLSQTSRPLSR